MKRMSGKGRRGDDGTYLDVFLHLDGLHVGDFLTNVTRIQIGNREK